MLVNVQLSDLISVYITLLPSAPWGPDPRLAPYGAYLAKFQLAALRAARRPLELEGVVSILLAL